MACDDMNEMENKQIVIQISRNPSDFVVTCYECHTEEKAFVHRHARGFTISAILRLRTIPVTTRHRAGVSILAVLRSRTN
jgi:hypothetical protein